MVYLDVLALGTPEEMTKPCVDCGEITVNFCDYCRAADRMPTQDWLPNQKTPFCMKCDRKHNKCKFCRADHAQTQANPATHGPGHDDGTRSRPVFGPEPPPGLIPGRLQHRAGTPDAGRRHPGSLQHRAGTCAPDRRTPK